MDSILIPELMDQNQILLDQSHGDPAVTVRPASREATPYASREPVGVTRSHGVTSAEKFLVLKCQVCWMEQSGSMGRSDRASTRRLRWCISIAQDSGLGVG